MKHSDYHGKLLRLAMVFVALFLCGTMAYAQTDRMISGIVVDENGDPLPAAHIRQVSQTKGEELAAVITDMCNFINTVYKTELKTKYNVDFSELRKVINSWNLIPGSPNDEFDHLNDKILNQ
jgi:hypothetical protein